MPIVSSFSFFGVIVLILIFFKPCSILPSLSCLSRFADFQICHAKGVIAEKRASLEECVSALKNAVETWQHSGREKNDIRMSLLLRDQPS